MANRILYLNQAVYEIKEALSVRDNPFYFIVGAGISYNSVPLAKDIVNICKEKIKKSGISFMDKDLNGAEEYSYWLQTAYPQPISRQSLFRTLIQDKKITPANFRLAHLLSYSKIGNIVVTPNFDDFLTRALSHFNVNHIICDHPDTAFKVNSEREELQLVHVHGTYLSYDCCNLTPEILERNKSSETTANTMASLLERVGESISPIVVGYSGWENDVIMTSLRKRLQSRTLPYNIYWFCYTSNELNNLPKWLKDHSNVVFVVPEENIESIVNEDESDISINIDDAGRTLINNASTLSAHIVFDRLVSALNLPEPEITEDPINFLIKFIGGTDVVSNQDTNDLDVFFLGHVIERLKKLKKLEVENEGTSNQNLHLFKSIRGFARRSQYVKAASLLKELNIDDFNAETLIELLEVSSSIIQNIDDEKEDFELSFFVLYNNIKIIDEIKKKTNTQDKHLINYLLNYLLNNYQIIKISYKLMGNTQDYINTLDKILTLYSQSDDPKLQIQIAKHNYEKARALEDFEMDQAIAIYKEIIEMNENSSEKEVINVVSSSANRLGILYSEINDFKNSHDFFDYMLANSDKLGQNAEAVGLLNKAITFSKEGKKKDSDLLFDLLESKYLNSEDEKIQSSVIIGLMFRARLADTDTQTSLELYNRIILHFGKSEFKTVKRQVGGAFSEKAFSCYKNGDLLTALNNFNEAFEHGETMSGINLFYMLRRNEIQQEMVPYSMEELIQPKLQENDSFALINQALNMVKKGEKNNRKWEDADYLISLVSGRLDEIKDWWHYLAKNNDTEGDLVLAWLAKHKVINDPDNLDLKDRFNKAKEWEIPEFMYNRGYLVPS